MKIQPSKYWSAILISVLILALTPLTTGATSAETMVIHLELGPEFANPLLGTWSGKISALVDHGAATQYWSHSGNPAQTMANHTENILVSDRGSLTIRSNTRLTTTYLEDGFEQSGSGNFTVITGTGIYADLHGQGHVQVQVHYSELTGQISVVMDFHGAAHFEP